MKHSNGVTSEVPGTEGVGVAELPPPTVDQIEKWLSRDLGVCMSLLNALLTDKELRIAMATFLQGRYQNNKNRSDPSQMDMFGANKGA